MVTCNSTEFDNEDCRVHVYTDDCDTQEEAIEAASKRSYDPDIPFFMDKIEGYVSKSAYLPSKTVRAAAVALASKYSRKEVLNMEVDRWRHVASQALDDAQG
jgi:hypothetical protein